MFRIFKITRRKLEATKDTFLTFFSKMGKQFFPHDEPTVTESTNDIVDSAEKVLI